jgi:hypothetical protein
MAASSKIVDLRKALAERFPRSPVSSGGCTATGIPFLDEITGGGLPNAAITEVISPQVSAGSASLIHALLRVAQREHYYLALIDGRDSFDPQSLDNACLSHLLWIRCTTAIRAIKAADLLLRDGNFTMLVLDLVLNAPDELRKISQTSWYRLQRLVESAPIAFVILTRQNMVASAQLKVILENSCTLETLGKGNAVSRLQFRIQRSHWKSEVGGRRTVGTGYLRHDSGCPSIV